MSEEKRVLVNVKVTPNKRQKWRTAVDESDEYSTLSHLIRLSVSRELAGLYEQDSNGESEIDGEVRSQLDDIQESVETVVESMGTVESEALSSTDITELADRIFDLIPEFEVVEREKERTPVEDLDEDELEGFREHIPEDAKLQHIEQGPDYDFGEIEPPADRLTTSDGVRILVRAGDVIDDVGEVDQEVRKLDESELRRLTDTGLLSVYREYLSVRDYDIQQAATKLEDEYPRVKIGQTLQGNDVIYKAVIHS
jgi:hypothetical protein